MHDDHYRRLFPPNFELAAKLVIAVCLVSFLLSISRPWPCSLAPLIGFFLLMPLSVLAFQGVIVSDRGLSFYILEPRWTWKSVSWAEIQNIEFGSWWTRAIVVKRFKGRSIRIFDGMVRNKQEFRDELTESFQGFNPTGNDHGAD